MAQVVIRNLDDDVKQSLTRRASLHGHSMEAEARLILANALKEKKCSSLGLGSKIAKRFAKAGFDEPLPELRGHAISPMDL